MPNKEKIKILLSDLLSKQSLIVKESEQKKIELLRGIKGDKGDIGPQGIPGPRGEKGEKGDMGERGEKGLQGQKGDKGEMGIPGQNGKDGRDGKDGQDAEIDIEQIKKVIQEIMQSSSTMGSRNQKIPPMHGGGASLIYNEIPTGTINAINTIFTLANVPKTGSVMVYLDGIRLNGTGFTISGRTLTMTVAPVTELVVDYAK